MYTKIRILLRDSLDNFKRELEDTNWNEETDDIETAYGTFFLILFIPSVVLLILALPTCIYFSHINGYNWDDILFFVNLPKNQLIHKYVVFPIPIPGSSITHPLLTSLLTAYGALGFVAAIMIRSGTVFRIFVQANGLFVGYQLTFTIIYYLSKFNVVNNSLGGQELYILKIVYIFLSFYLFESLIDLFAHEGYRGDKFRFLFNGLNALACGWILSKAFGNSSVALNGILFISITFMSIWFWEFLASMVFKFLNRYGIKMKMFGKAFVPVKFNKKLFVSTTKKIWREDNVLIIMLSFINFAFPFAAYMIWSFIISRI